MAEAVADGERAGSILATATLIGAVASGAALAGAALATGPSLLGSAAEGLPSGAANGLDAGRLSAPKQESISTNASANPSIGSLNVACAALTSIIGAVVNLRTNCPSAPSSITTNFGPTTTALASLRNTG